MRFSLPFEIHIYLRLRTEFKLLLPTASRNVLDRIDHDPLLFNNSGVLQLYRAMVTLKYNFTYFTASGSGRFILGAAVSSLYSVRTFDNEFEL